MTHERIACRIARVRELEAREECLWKVTEKFQKNGFDKKYEQSSAITGCGHKWNWFPKKAYCPSCGGKIVRKDGGK